MVVSPAHRVAPEAILEHSADRTERCSLDDESPDLACDDRTESGSGDGKV